MAAPTRPVLAVFASDKGPGDAQRSSIMSQAGSLLARRGARLVCLAEARLDCIPLLTSARSAGGEVSIVADEGFVVPPALTDVPVELLADPEARMRRIGELANGFVGLPGSLKSAAALYKCWEYAGAGLSGKPVVLLNHHRAFEVMRGFSVDVLKHSVKRQDRMVVFTDQVEDLWNKIAWALNETGQTAIG